MEERRKDQPLMQSEWKLWLEQNFYPWIKDEEIAHDRLNRVAKELFGDGNGDAGIRADVKLLMCSAHRLDAWLDGVKRLWKFAAAVVIPLIATAAVMKSVGWL